MTIQFEGKVSAKTCSSFGRHISDSHITQYETEGRASQLVNQLSLEILKNSSENALDRFMSPRTLLNEKRREGSKNLIESLDISSSSPREMTFYPQRCKSRISLENLSVGVLDLEKYRKLKTINSKRAAVFNQNLYSSIHDSLLVAHIQSIDFATIDTVVEKLVIKHVNKYLSSDLHLIRKTVSEFDTIALMIAQKIYIELVNSDPLFQKLPLQQNIIRFKIIVARVLFTQKRCCRSEWLDSLVFNINQALFKESTRGFSFYQSDSITNHFTFLIYILRNKIKDQNIYSLFLRMFHSNPQVSEKIIDYCLFWMNSKALPKLVALVENQLRLYQHHNTVQNRVFEFSHETLHLIEKMKQVDQEQVARSYTMGSQMNYEVLQVNGKGVNTQGIEGTSKDCQKKFFFRFLRQLYENGLSEKRGERAISGEVNKFISRKKSYTGSDILFLGSNSAWATCDQKLRSLFPLLFTNPYNTRLQQGTNCYIQVESEKKYSLLVEKKYCTYPLMDPSNHDSFAIDQNRPLLSLKVCWQVNYDSKKFWTYTISTPVVESLKATDDEFKRLLKLMMVPFPVDGAEMLLQARDASKAT